MTNQVDGKLNNSSLTLRFKESLIRKKEAFNEWHPPLWLKITAVVLFTLLGVTSFSIALVGALTLIGAHIHIGALASLNSTITSIWKGLPYLMAAMGGPAVLIALGLMAYGVYNAIKAIQEHRKKQATEHSNEIPPVAHPKNKVTIQNRDFTLKSYPCNDTTWAYATKAISEKDNNAVFIYLNSETHISQRSDGTNVYIPKNDYVVIYYSSNEGYASNADSNINELISICPQINNATILTE